MSEKLGLAQKENWVRPQINGQIESGPDLLGPAHIFRGLTPPLFGRMSKFRILLEPSLVFHFIFAATIVHIPTILVLYEPYFTRLHIMDGV